MRQSGKGNCEWQRDYWWPLMAFLSHGWGLECSSQCSIGLTAADAVVFAPPLRSARAHCEEYGFLFSVDR